MTPSSADERALLPCPFCGCVAEFKPYKRDGLTLKCSTFGCVKFDQRSLRYSLDWLRDRMTDHWNRRASLGAAQVPAVSRETVVEWLDANDIEVTDRQLNGLFSATAAQVPTELQRQNIIFEFLERTGQYVTNDASREHAIKCAVDKALQEAGAAQVPAGSALVDEDWLKKAEEAIYDMELFGHLWSGEEWCPIKPTSIDKYCAACRKTKGADPAAGAAQVPSLSDADMRSLRRFQETTEDDQSYDIGKKAVQSLANAGALRYAGGSRYQVTDYGMWLLSQPSQQEAK